MNKIITAFCLFFFAGSVNYCSFAKIIFGQKIQISNTGLTDTLKKKEKSTADYIHFYQKFISGARAQECPMYPSCSNFGLKAFNEKSFASAFVLTADRLMRCGHDRNNYDLTLRPNGFKFIDFPGNDSVPKGLYYKRNSYYFAYSDSLPDDSAYIFIKKLINNNYYREALLEIMRIETKAPFNIELFINKIIALTAVEEYEKALFEYEVKCPEQYKKNPQLLYQVAVIEYKLQNFDIALKDVHDVKNCNDSFLLSKFIYLDGLIYANKYEWQQSLQSFDSLAAFASYKPIAQSNSKLVEEAFAFKDKSAIIAGTLSIIPGLGYVYAGHKQSAISAFIVNGLLAYATYSNFKKENYGMGVLTGVFSLSFYIANIYGSSKSARRYNQQRRESIIRKLEYNFNL